MVSKQLLKKLQIILAEEYKINVNDDEIKAIAESLVSLFYILFNSDDDQI